MHLNMQVHSCKNRADLKLHQIPISNYEHRESFMSAHIVLILLNELRKK